MEAQRLGAVVHRHHPVPLSAAGALVLQTVQRQRIPVYLRAGDGLPRRLPRTARGAGTDHRRLPLRSGPQPAHTPHLAADEPHRVRGQRHLHPLLPHRRGHAHRLPGLLPRLGEHRSGADHDRPDHRRQIHRRLSHAEDIPSLTGPAHRDLRTEQRPCRGDARGGDGRLQRHTGTHARRRADPPVERKRAQRHDPDDSGHLHGLDLRHPAGRAQHRHAQCAGRRRTAPAGGPHPHSGRQRADRERAGKPEHDPSRRPNPATDSTP